MVNTPGLKRELRDMLNTELGEKPSASAAPDRTDTAAMHEAIDVMNSLLDGTGVDDDQIRAARRRLQGAFLGLPVKEKANAR